LEIATDRPRPAVQTFTGNTVAGAMSPQLRARVDALASQLGASPYMVMLAAFSILIGRYANTEDVVVGSAVANRSTPESESVMSSLVNTVVLRTDTSGAPSFVELVGRVRSTALDALDHQDVPFTHVVSAMQSDRDLSRSPLFQVFFNVQNAPFALPDLEALSVEEIPVDRRASQFDLTLSIDMTMSDIAELEYNSDLFDRPRMERLFQHFWNLLATALDDPSRSIADLEMLGSLEMGEFEQEWRSAEVDRVPSTIVELFDEQVGRTPARTAVQFDDAEMSYASLAARSNQMARHLMSLGVQRGDLIGVHLHRSADMVAVLLAIMKAGAAYVPLDPSFPSDRLTYMASDAGLRLVFTQSELLDSPVVQALTAVRVDDDAIFAGVDDSPLPLIASPDDLAYVLYTSGSTGKPKGVMLEHRTVTNFLESMATRPGLGIDDVLVAVTTLSFDISVLELFLPLVVGARTVIVSRETAVDAGALIHVIASTGATIMQATPTTWRMLLESGWTDGKGLTALCGGEPMPRDLASSLRSVCRAVWNMYGPTETTVWSSVHPVSELNAGVVSIGKAIDNTRMYVLDARRQLVPAGVPGELYIGGEVLARGYLGRPELTEERFVPDPFRPGRRMYRTGDVVRRLANGDHEFVGRVDNQVKVRGYRIELGEIEAVLTQHPQVREAVVQPVEFGNNDARLVGYVIPVDANEPPESAAMRAWLQETLPDYMVPTSFVLLDEFPLTPNNKVDRKALPKPSVQGDERRSEPPLPGVESAIAAIWEEVLGVSGIGRHDDFFALGGHSLLAVRAFAQISQATGQSLPLSVLFRAPNVAQLARHIEVPELASRWTSLVAVQPNGSRPPLFYVSPFLITALSFSHLARALGDDQPFYVLQPQGMEGDDAIHERVADMASHYIAEIKTVQPQGPYYIGGHCAGGWVAFEIAQQLQANGDELALLAVVDVEPPNIEPPKVNRVRYLMRRVRRYARNRDVISALRWKSSVNLERHLIRRRGDAHQRRVAELRRVHAQAHNNYRAACVVRGDLLLLRSEEWASFPERDWHLRWSEMITGDLNVSIVPGSHAQLVESPNSEALARLIGDALKS
ncbi:MAG: amino acid adenylation domain-containing protein, partial [Acidimicrobiia bacterium]